MNRTDAIKAHKLSSLMVAALESAQYSEHDAKREGLTGYVVYGEVNARTRKALHDRGLMEGHYYVTREGVNILAALAGNTVDAAMMSAPGVEIQDMPNEPEFDAPGAAECYFGCGAPVVAVFVDYVGRTEGVCASHRVRVDGETYDVPATPENGSQRVTVIPPVDPDSIRAEIRETEALPLVTDSIPALANDSEVISMTEEFKLIGVSQNTPGMRGAMHYHAEGCRDIAREMRKYGQYEDEWVYELTVSNIAEILEFEFSDVSNGEWVWMIAEANDPTFGIKVMPCARELGIPNGRTDNGPLVTADNFFREGFDAPSVERVNEARAMIDAHNVNTCDERECITCMVKLTEECQENHKLDAPCAACSAMVIEYDESARKFPCLMVGGIIMHKGECAQSTGVNGPVCSLENDESDAGFVETDSVEDYAIVSRLSTGAEFHTVKDESTSTGTTHHTMDAHGGQWERFDHVLSVGDIVRSTETGRALYEVYALIPGLPVVYVDPCDGRAPFPMGATKLYAL